MTKLTIADWTGDFSKLPLSGAEFPEPEYPGGIMYFYRDPPNSRYGFYTINIRN